MHIAVPCRDRASQRKKDSSRLSQLRTRGSGRGLLAGWAVRTGCGGGAVQFPSPVKGYMGFKETTTSQL